MNPTARRILIAAATTPSVAAVAVVVLVFTAFTALASGSDDGNRAVRAAACNPAGAAVPGLTAEQTGNAATIVSVADARGLGIDGAVVGVMTALTESSLMNIGFGDAAGPDSRGLFQQRDSWGPASVRMDPAGAAGLFYDRLETITGWQTMAPWAAAQQVQHSAFSNGSNYAANYQTAIQIAADLGGSTGSAVPAKPGDSTDAEPAGFDIAAFCAADTAVSDGVTAGAWGGFSNGQIPATAMCPLSAAGQLLRCDAATAWDGMAAAYRAATGSALCITDSYRSYDVQVRLHAEKPTLAAVPGTSNHGWALAVDLCEPGRAGMEFSTATYKWLNANAARFGFMHPEWAEPGRGQEEPWHWEYTRGTR